MQPRAVAKVDDVVSHIGHSFAVINVVFLSDFLHFQIQEKTLLNSVVAAVALGVHVAHHAMLGQQRLMLSVGELGEFDRSSQ